MYNNVVECLTSYKNDLINLGKNLEQRKFLSDSFSRWYINSLESGDVFFPEHNLVIIGIDDIKYANKEKKLSFNVVFIIKKSEEIHKKYKMLCLTIEESYPNKFSNMITARQEKRLRNLYIKNNGGIDEHFYFYRNKLLALYNLIGANNMHLSIPPIFKGIELFGSPLNTHNDKYCSPFSIEKKFGSLGSFWEYCFNQNGIYLCNPPFDESIIHRMCVKLLEDLKNTEYNVVVIITIPVWDTASQSKLKIKNYGLKFKGYECLVNTSFLRERDILDKNKYPYYNYYTDKLVPASYTHLLILSNIREESYKKKINILKKMWLEFSSK